MSRSLLSRRRVGLAALAALACAHAAYAAPCAPINAPGQYQLAANCDGPLIINADNVTLDLNGKTIDGASGSFDGIGLTAGNKNITITNGAIKDAQFGINAPNNSRVRVERVTFTNCNSGIIATASDSSFARNDFKQRPGSVAINLTGSRNLVCYNRIEDGVQGLNVIGDDNRLLCNRTAVSVFGYALLGGKRNHFVSNIAIGGAFGILLAIGDDNILRRNRTVGQESVGIGLNKLSKGNLIEANYSFGPGADLFDDNLPTCQNTWKRNLFVDDGELGADLGPHAGCIQ